MLKPIIQKANLKHNKYEKAISKNTTLENAIRVSNDFNISFTTHGTNFQKVITGKYKSRASVKMNLAQRSVGLKPRTKKVKSYSMPFSMSQMVSVGGPGGPGRTGFGKKSSKKLVKKQKEKRTKKTPRKKPKRHKKRKETSKRQKKMI